MTDQIAHILTLVFPAAIILAIVAVMRIGRARLRQPGQRVIRAGANARSFEARPGSTW